MDVHEHLTDKEVSEQCNIWIEQQIKQKVIEKYPEDSDKAHEYFKRLMLDGNEIAKLQSQFYNNE